MKTSSCPGLLLSLLCVLSTALAAQAQSNYEPYIVSTYAGTPPGSADGTGSNARFNSPSAVAVDSIGNIFVADYVNSTIRKIAPGGVVTTFAGVAETPGNTDGTGSGARFNGPYGVAIDGSNNVFVVDSANHTIRKITPSGVVTTFAGLAGNVGSADGTGSSARFNFPSAAAFDNSGNLYVADTGNNTIRRITPAGLVSTVAGTPGVFGSADGTGPAAQFNGPAGIAVDRHVAGGNIYITDSNNETVRQMTPAGMVTTLAGSPGLIGGNDGTGSAARFDLPGGITVNSIGDIYVADTDSSIIRKVTQAGVVTTFAGAFGQAGSVDAVGTAARFNLPVGLCVDSSDNIYVADNNNETIRKITTGASVTTIAGLPSPGTVDGTGSSARFDFPDAVTFDGAGNMFVTDPLDSVIRKIAPGAVVTTFAGTPGVVGSADGTGSAAQFANPRFCAADKAGNVYVADTFNFTIRQITPAGVVTTIAGLAGAAGIADGTGSAARFNGSRGIAVDPHGNLYVCDQPKHTIRKIAPGGVVTTFAGLANNPGSADGTGSAARFNFPSGVATDSAGNVYVTDNANNTIRKITPAGVVTTLAGTPGVNGFADGTGPAAQFAGPYGIVVDNAGNIYTVEEGNNTIRKITPAGVVTTLAGLPPSPGATDGTGSAAKFNSPRGIGMDDSGKLFVGDIGNHVIRGATPPVPLMVAGATPNSALESIEGAGRQTNEKEMMRPDGVVPSFAVAMPQANNLGIECRTAGPANNYSMVFNFVHNITAVGSAAVTSGVGSVSSFSIAGSQVTVHMTGVANAQTIVVTLTNVSDSTGTRNVQSALGILIGDTNGDGQVNSGDIGLTKSQSGIALSSTNFREDLNIDGIINSGDVGLAKSKSGTALP